MAEKTSVTKAYGSARLARIEAEKILNGTAGRGGLESSWLRIQERYANRNKPGMFTEQIADEYKRVKTAYDKWAKKYQDAVALETKYKEELDSVTQQENKTKDAKKAADRLAEAKAEKARADSLIPSRGKAQADAAAAAVAEAEAAYNEMQGKSTTPTKGGDLENKALYDDYTLNADGTVTNKDAVESYFVGEPDAKGEIAQTPFTSLAKARDAFLKNYAAPGKIAELQKQLLTSGYVKDNNIKDGTWVLGVDKLIKDYTYQSVSDVKYSGVKEPLSLNSFLVNKRVSSGSGPTRYRVITTRGDAKKLIDNYMSDLIGSGATPEEESAFYNELNAAENKAVRTTTGGTTTGSVLQEADRLMIAAKVARKRLRNSNVDELLNSNVGSTVAIDIAAMQKYAAKYGIQMTAAEALKRVADGIGQENYAAKQQERLKLVAKQLHPNLAAHIDAGGTVEDIADQYAFAKSRKLGVAIPVSTVDKDVMDAVNKGMSVSDFNIELQKKPEWRFTEEANQIADNFTNTMLKTFGLVG